MRGFSFSSLRARLLLLVLLAVIPALGLILYSAAEQRRLAALEAQANALQLARSVSSSHDDLIEGAHQLLTTLAQTPVVRGSDPTACNSVLGTLLKKYTHYTNLGVNTPSGDVICSALSLSGPVNVADRAWFRRALESRDLVISDYIIGRVTGKATLGLGYPVLGEAGEVQAVLYAGLDLGWLNKIAAKTLLPAGTALTAIDRQGTVLVGFPDPDKWVGKSMSETPLVQTILSQGEGTAELLGMDGVARLYGFSPLGDTGGAYVSIGIPKDVAFAAANQILFRNLAGMGIVATLALLAAWFGADIFVLQRVRVLLDATTRLSGSDLKARTGLPYEGGELGQLARAFDEMASTLQAQHAASERADAERKRAEEEIQRQLQRITALRDINIAITSTLDLHSVLSVLMEKIDLFLPYTAVLVWLWNKESGLLERAACWNLNEEEWKGRKLAGTPFLVKEAIEGKAPVVVRNVQTDARTVDAAFYRKHGLISYLGVPLLVKGEVLGVLVFLTREEHEFGSEEVQFLSTLAGQAAIAIHNSQLYEQTKKQAVELEAANKAQADFAAMIAHDLRAPLTAVISGAAMLEDGLFGPVNEEQKKWLAKIQDSSGNLVDLVSDFLDISKLEAGHIDLIKGEVKLDRLIQDTLDTLLPLAAIKKLSLASHVAPALVPIKADHRRLEQVLANLLSNAIKFTREGGAIEVGASRENGTASRVWVRDTGVGIPARELGSLFEKYRQTTSGQTAEQRGTGLGLVICKMIVEAHGGKIWAESEEGKGTTVTFTLPYGG